MQDEFELKELEMGDVVTEVVELPKEFREGAPLEPYHLIAVKRDQEGSGYGLLFGGEFLIDATSIVALYNAETQRLKCFHCVECAVIVINWLKSQQNEWERIFSSGFDESTGEGPKRTLN